MYNKNFLRFLSSQNEHYRQMRVVIMPSDNRKLGADTKRKGNQEYYVVAFVKNTNQENGSGHVSVSAIKRSPGRSKFNHLSFFPGPIGALVNQLTLGSVPTAGRFAESHHEDFEEADHVLVKKIEKTQYQEINNATNEFKEDVKNKSRLYAVFGATNPIAPCLTGALTFTWSSWKTQLNHKRLNCHPAPEDMCGVEVYDDETHVLASGFQPDNCTSSVTHVLNKGGFSLKNPVVPTFFTNKLTDEHGFERMDKEQFCSLFKK